MTKLTIAEHFKELWDKSGNVDCFDIKEKYDEKR